MPELAARESRLGELTNRFCGAHRVQRAGHQLCRACAVALVHSLRLEQLSVSEDYAELVIQSMEEKPQVRVDGRTIGGAARLRPARHSTGH